MKNRNVFVAGHRGMVGSAIVRILRKKGSVNIIIRTREELDLKSQKDVETFFEKEQIDEVYLAAAKVGGILANNNYPADFIVDNLLIQTNVISSAHKNGINKLLFLGSSCIYPKHADQPMSESALLTGGLEPTNAPYAIAKIAGIKICESYNRQYNRDYRSVMPTNLYGPGDNFHPENSHVIPALIRRLHEAKINGESTVSIWGSGTAKREFLHVDDMAAACIHIMDLPYSKYSKIIDAQLSHINVGTGQDCTIRELAETIADITGYKGSLSFDTSKPDGAPRKLLNITKLKKLGWNFSYSLESGIQDAYRWFLDNGHTARL